MLTSYLSKSDYKVARNCHTKLYYKKQGYPNLKEGDAYLQMLAEGGYMVGKMAQLLYPRGIEIQTADNLQALQETEEYLKLPEVTLFEPAFYANHKFMRADILIKQGAQIKLIEVKAKSFDGALRNEQFWSKRPHGIKNDWLDYLEEVAFQVLTLNEALPEARINASLLLPDKTKDSQIDDLASKFRIIKPQGVESFRRYQIDFLGDVDQVREEHILTEVNVDREVEHLISEVEKWSKSYIACLENELIRVQVPINKQCRDCEFKASNQDERDGYKECWGELAEVSPHILDLFSVGSVGGSKKPLVNELIAQGKVSLYDMPLEELTKQDGSLGRNGFRQKLQIEKTKVNQEWLSPTFGQIVASCEYPLHFIDFETLALAVPPHKSMRPYEQVAFQWSCHTLWEPQQEPEHREWLNTENIFPNFQFAETLMDCIGESGTVFMWATHENTILRNIWLQAQRLGYKNQKLLTWIEGIAKLKWAEGDGRLIDMNRLCFDHYFHPRMKGKTSIKYVLPAIWEQNAYLHEIPWLKKYFREEEQKVLNPYSILTSIDIAGKAEKVKEGTGAMRAYQEMVYGLHKDDPQAKADWGRLLREYCKLDTLAMVIIWIHWNNLLNSQASFE